MPTKQEVASSILAGRTSSASPELLIATSNSGKLRDFAAIAERFGIQIASLAGFASLPAVEEDGATFAANARKKAEFYSRYAGERLLLADDSGLEVEALGGAPGVRSARYAADSPTSAELSLTVDEANNARLLRELRDVPENRCQARFVCVLAAARQGKTLATFSGEVRGAILRGPRGENGFGYDPLFLIPELGKTSAELAPQEKARVSHRAAAFSKFLEWYKLQEG